MYELYTYTTFIIHTQSDHLSLHLYPFLTNSVIYTKLVLIFTLIRLSFILLQSMALHRPMLIFYPPKDRWNLNSWPSVRFNPSRVITTKRAGNNNPIYQPVNNLFNCRIQRSEYILQCTWTTHHKCKFLTEIWDTCCTPFSKAFQKRRERSYYYTNHSSNWAN